MIEIQLNGATKEVPENLKLDGLLEWLKLPADRVAVERNREVVNRERWAETPVLPGDRFEVVHFVGGGVGDDGEERELQIPRENDVVRFSPSP